MTGTEAKVNRLGNIYCLLGNMRAAREGAGAERGFPARFALGSRQRAVAWSPARASRARRGVPPHRPGVDLRVGERQPVGGR